MIDLALRQRRIGGSEVGPVFGVDEYRTPYGLWLEKHGWLAPRTPNLRMTIGKLNEPVILALYTLITGRAVRHWDQTECDPVRPFVVRTIDGFCTEEPRMLELKTVFPDQYAKWGATEDKIPPSAALQCRYYLASKYPEYEVCDLCVLKGDKLEIHTIEHDPEIARALFARVEEWWRRYVVGDEELPIDGSLETTRWLEQKFPRHKRPDMRAATAEEIALLSEYAEVRSSQKLLKTWRSRLENQLREAIGEREGIECDAGKLTWHKTKDGETVKWEAMSWALLTNFIKDKAEREKLLAEYTRPKPGYQRLNFRWKGVEEEE